MDHKVTDKNMNSLLPFVAPGTAVRDGIDNVLRANTGGLFVFASKEKLTHILDGGFEIDCPFSPNYLYELAKMDGAIILSEDGSRILIANGQLSPDTSIPSSETGMRHRTAERTAKQIGALVIAISQRRNVITLYKSNQRYVLRDISVMLTKSNVALATLDKYKNVLEQDLMALSILEYDDLVTYADVLNVFHRVEMVLKIKAELLEYLKELGIEGRLIKLQMDEILYDLEKEIQWLIKDYSYSRNISSADICHILESFTEAKVLEEVHILRLLGYTTQINELDSKKARGYRNLAKISKLPPAVIENLVEYFKDFATIAKAPVEELDKVDGIGAVRAKKIYDGLKSIKAKFLEQQ